MRRITHAHTRLRRHRCHLHDALGDRRRRVLDDQPAPCLEDYACGLGAVGDEQWTTHCQVVEQLYRQRKVVVGVTRPGNDRRDRLGQELVDLAPFRIDHPHPVLRDLCRFLSWSANDGQGHELVPSARARDGLDQPGCPLNIVPSVAHEEQVTGI